jgi:hypothetical protein
LRRGGGLRIRAVADRDSARRSTCAGAARGRGGRRPRVRRWDSRVRRGGEDDGGGRRGERGCECGWVGKRGWLTLSADLGRVGKARRSTEGGGSGETKGTNAVRVWLVAPFYSFQYQTTVVESRMNGQDQLGYLG